MVEKDIIKELHFLKGLPDSLVEKIASIATLESHDKHTVLFQQHQDLTHLFMIVSGKVYFTIASASGKALILDKIHEGRTFGVWALMEESSTAYSAVCAEKSTVVSIPGKLLHQLFEEDFKLGHLLMLNVVELLKERIELHTRQFLLSLASSSEID